MHQARVDGVSLESLRGFDWNRDCEQPRGVRSEDTSFRKYTCGAVQLSITRHLIFERYKVIRRRALESIWVDDTGLCKFDDCSSRGPTFVELVRSEQVAYPPLKIASMCDRACEFK